MTNRVKLNLRVSKSVLDAYEGAILDKYPQIRPYAGVELERELRAYVDQGDAAALQEVINECRSELEIARQKKENRSISLRRGETQPVQYQIDASIKASVKQMADNSHYRSAGELVERVMHQYVCEGSVISRCVQRLDAVQESLENHSEQEDLGVKQRRTREIDNKLPEGQFSIDDFKQALDETSGISSSDHGIETYLPRVLSMRDYTTHPKVKDVFLPADDEIAPDQPDPRQQRSELIDEEDIQLGLKLVAYEKAVKSVRDSALLDLTEAVDVFDGGFSRDTIRRHIRSIADKYSGYRYNEDRDCLLAKQKDIENSDPEIDILVELVDYSS